MTSIQTLYDRESCWTRIMDPDLVEASRQWARDNGLDPNIVALETITLETVNGERVIRYTEYLLNEDGYKYVDPNDRPRAATEQRTVPCLVEPPVEWIRPEDRP